MINTLNMHIFPFHTAVGIAIPVIIADRQSENQQRSPGVTGGKLLIAQQLLRGISAALDRKDRFLFYGKHGQLAVAG